MEPYSDILISMAILDTTIKRYIQAEGLKKEDMISVLRLSVSNQYGNMVRNAEDILAVLSEDNKNLSDWIKKLAYSPNPIESKKEIYKKLDKYGKYYLD